MSLRADPELDDLIADILIDAYDHDEALMGFENAFDEAGCLPCRGIVIGEDIEILSVAAANGWCGPVTAQPGMPVCERAALRHHRSKGRT